jgi:hypothetical protein
METMAFVLPLRMSPTKISTASAIANELDINIKYPAD